MALDVSKLRQQEQVQATGSNPAASTSTSSSSQPINMTTGSISTEEKRQKEIEFINSTEFKNCPDEDKTELLKQQFPYLSELSKEDFNKYVEDIKVAAQEKTQEATETETPTPSTQESEVTETEGGQPAVINSELEEKLKAKEQELKTLITEYAKDSGQQNIDLKRLIDELNKKQLRNEKLSEIEQNILNLSQEIETIKDVNNKRQETLPSDEEAPVAGAEAADGSSWVQKLFTDKFINNPVFKNIKDADEKLHTCIESYLEKNDPNFTNLSKKQQNKLVSEYTDTLHRLASEMYPKENGQKRTVHKQIHKIIEYANKHNISLEELKNIDAQKLKEEIKREDIKNLNIILNAVKDNTTQSFDYDKKLYMISQLYLEETGELSENADEAIANMVDNLIMKTTRIKPNDETRNQLAIKATLILEYYAESNPEELNTALSNGNFKASKRILNEITIEQAKKRLEDPNLGTHDRTAIENELNKANDLKELYDAYPNRKLERPEELYSTICDYEKAGNELNLTLKELKTNLEKNLGIREDTGIELPVEIETSPTTEALLNGEISLEDKEHAIEEMYTKALPDFEGLSEDEIKTKLIKSYLEAETETINENIKEIQLEVTLRLASNFGFDSKRFEQEIKNSREAQAGRITRASDEEFLDTYTQITDERLRLSVAKRHSSWDDISHDTNKKITRSILQGNNADEINAVSEGNALNNTKEENIDIAYTLANDPKITEKNLGLYGEKLVEFTQGDDNKLALGQGLSQTGNAALLEGAAAAADSIQNQNYRNQYNSVITEAAQNYPPEVQKTIQSVLTTGQISEQTRNSTAPASNSYYPDADTYTPSTSSNSSNTYQQSTSSTTQQTYNSGYQQSTTSTVDYTTPVAGRTYTPSNLDITQAIIENSSRQTTAYTPASQTASTPSVDTAKVREQAQQAQVEASQQMKDIALENVAEVKAKIDESIAEWELKQELKLSDEVVSEFKEIAASEALEEFIQTNPTKKQEIIQKLSSATSLSEVYDILLSNLGSKVHQKFIDNLASAGSTSEVRAFLKSKAGNTAVIKEILLRTSNQTLRSELINMLPASDVIELLENNLISTLNSIDHKIIYEYLAKNIYSMTQTNFANYLKYLPFDEREKLIAMRNQAYGIKSEQNQKAEAKVETTTQGAQQDQQTVTQTQPTQQSVVTNPQTPQHTSAQQKPEQQVGNPQTQFKGGETTKVLNDGRIITRQGTSFAGISDNAEEGFRVVDPKADKKAKEGAPIGMNDEVLVPGSQEWLMKYNKQAPKTAFTMAALEEQAEDTGLNLGSNHAKIGQPIKKKYNPNGFNLRG